MARFFRRRLHRATRWPDYLPPHAPQGDPCAVPAPGQIGVTFLGHACFLLRIPKADGSVLTVLTDPVFSERCGPFNRIGPRRVVPPGRPLAALPPVDVILISHCHYDHLDIATLAALARRDDPIAIAPFGNRRLLRRAGLSRVMTRDWWDGARLPCGTRITVTPARHGSARTPFDANTRLWGGFMIAGPDADAPRVLFAGDTAHGTHWRAIAERLGSPDLALLPIGAYAPRALMHRVHMGPEEAVEACLELGAGRAIGMHFGTFRLTDEPVGEPPVRFRLAARARGLDPHRCFTLGLGDATLVATAPARAASPHGNSTAPDAS